MEVRAIAKDIRISPRKLRLVTELIQGKKVDEAMAMLKFAPTPAARAVAKVVKSAAANADNNFQMEATNLWVVKAVADGARPLKRFRPQPRGRAYSILRRGSHITIIVGEREG